MRRRNKLAVIGDSWIKAANNVESDDYISSEEVEFRREKCFGCSYCSMNVSKERLKFIESLYGKVMGDYCTICACPISKKVIAPEEECARGQKNLPPLWNRIAVVTADPKDINIINKSPRKINIDIFDNAYTIFVGQLSGDMTFEYEIESTQEITDVIQVTSKCPCVKVNSYTFSDRKINISITMVHKYLRDDLFSNWIYTKYKTLETKPKRVGIKIIGKRI